MNTIGQYSITVVDQQRFRNDPEYAADVTIGAMANFGSKTRSGLEKSQDPLGIVGSTYAGYGPKVDVVSHQRVEKHATVSKLGGVVGALAKSGNDLAERVIQSSMRAELEQHHPLESISPEKAGILGGMGADTLDDHPGRFGPPGTKDPVEVRNATLRNLEKIYDAVPTAKSLPDALEKIGRVVNTDLAAEHFSKQKTIENSNVGNNPGNKNAPGYYPSNNAIPTTQSSLPKDYRLDQLAELGRVVDTSPPPIVYGPIYPVDTYPKIGPQFLPSPTNVSFPDVDSLAGSYGFGSGFAGWLSRVFGAAKPNHFGKSFEPREVKNALQKGLIDEEAVIDAVVAETGVPRQKAHDALDAQRGYGTRSRSEREAAHDSSGTESGHSASRGEYRPILLDLDGDGVQITELSKSTVFMDAGGDGLLHRTAWAGAGDAVLFIDDDGDGAISEKKEYVFTEWDPTATDDLAALRAVFDSNGDGVLDASDARFADFKVLVTNADGSTTAKTLTELGITSITPDLSFAEGSSELL